MNTSPYQQALTRIRAEYVEMPGMRLTAGQVERLSGVDVSICKLVLDDLVRSKFFMLDRTEAMREELMSVPLDCRPLKPNRTPGQPWCPPAAPVNRSRRAASH